MGRSNESRLERDDTTERRTHRIKYPFAIIPTLANFNQGKMDVKQLSSNSYYVKSGRGQATLEAINKECREKFPNKSFSDLEGSISDNHIVICAYLFKEVQYLVPFDL